MINLTVPKGLWQRSRILHIDPYLQLTIIIIRLLTEDRIFEVSLRLALKNRNKHIQQSKIILKVCVDVVTYKLNIMIINLYKKKIFSALIIECTVAVKNVKNF